MSEMSRETDALLKRGRGGESLSPHDRSRLKRAVLAQAAAASVVATTSTAAAWTTVAAKVAVGVAIVGSVVGVGVGVVPTWTAKAPAHVAVTAPHATARHAEAREPAISIPPPPPPPGATAPAVVPEPVQPVVPIAKQHETVRPSPLEEETRGWNDADDALRRGDHDTTLRLLSELDARFPEGALAPERAAERVFALCAAGRTDEARQASNDFFRRQSVGPLAARVRSACGSKP